MNDAKRIIVNIFWGLIVAVVAGIFAGAARAAAADQEAGYSGAQLESLQMAPLPLLVLALGFICGALAWIRRRIR